MELKRLKVEDTEIEYIYHISDIHIRNGERYEEYGEVFDELYKTLKKEIEKKESLIVITGDVMHSKVGPCPNAYDIVRIMLESLEKIGSVIMIPGNHDFNQANKESMDSLTPIIKASKFDNVYYLKESGIYQYNNILFGISSIIDGTIVKSESITSEMCNMKKYKNIYKIALYHGMLKGAQMDNGFTAKSNSLNRGVFKGYDYVLLGDIHKYQYVNTKKTIAYAGSLIQQSHSEKINGHGILKWSLLNGKTKFIDIKNRYGLCTINIENGKMKETIIPECPYIKFVLKNTTEIEYMKIYNELSKKYNIWKSRKINNIDINDETNEYYKNDKNTITNNTSKIIQETSIKRYLKNKKLNEDKIEKIIKLHNKIKQKINFEENIEVENNEWRILELNFSNMLSYGENNIIDFTKYNINEIIGIIGPNHSGKSSILDIILYCLFGKFSRSSENKDILNKNKIKLKCLLKFSIGNNIYTIERDGYLTNKGTLQNHIQLHETKNINGKTITKNLTGINKDDTNNKIRKLVGKYEDYVKTYIQLQHSTEKWNFIEMTNKDKDEYINNALSLDIFAKCYKFAKKKENKLKQKMNECKNNINILSIDELKNKINECKQELQKLNETKNNIKNDKITLDIILEKIKIPSLVNYHELTKYDLTSENKIENKIKEIQQYLDQTNHNNITKLSEELNNKYNKLIQERENMNYYTTFKKLIKGKEKEKEKIILLPTHLLETNINELINEKMNIEKQINLINEKINKLKLINKIDKSERINFIKTRLLKLKSIEQPNIKLLERELCTLQNKKSDLFEILINKEIDIMEKRKITQEYKNKIINTIELKQKISKHIKLINKKINEINQNINDEQLNCIINENNKLIERHYNYKKDEELINIEVDIDIDDINNNLKIINSKIIDITFKIIESKKYTIINKEIEDLENELSTLKETLDIQKEIKILKTERIILYKQLKFTENNIYDIQNYEIHTESNNEIKKLINKIDDEIDKLTDTYEHLTIKINKYEQKINKQKKELKKIHKYTMLTNILKEYQIYYINYKYESEIYNTWTLKKENIEHELNKVNNDIKLKKLEINNYTDNLKKYSEIETKYEKLNAKCGIYKLYCELMNHTGFSYEIKKIYIPIIEKEINNILQLITDFTVKFILSNTNETKKTKKGKIDINICRINNNDYNTTLASGFENFILRIVIRMALCKITMASKPNFFVIDEGWSCLDSHHLNNIDDFMNFMKMQYEHVIIISHLEQLKNQSKYDIHIEKRNTFSYINNITNDSN